MSLWSPVDLVTGSVPPHSNSLSSQNAKDESSSVNHSNESGSKLTGNRAHRSSNLPHSDHSNGSSSSVHNQASVSPNSLVMSSRRPANIPRAHSGSNLTHNPHSNEGHNKLSPSSSSSSSKDNKNQQGISAKRRRVDQFLEQKTGHVFQGKSALSDPNEPMPLQLVKSQRRHGPDVCDIPKEESESAKASSRHDEDDAPLNLCVKPSSSSSSATHSRTTESRRSEMSSRANNALRAHASYPASHSLHAELLSLAGVQPDSAAYPRKRGRRPKSLLAATNSVSSLSVAPPVMPALQEKPKKKRGRPPLYSPPPNIVIGNRLIPGALPTTQLQPGWPTFTPSGQIVFPSKSNGNSSAMSASHQSRPNVRKPSETETDDDSDVSSRPDYKEGVTQEDIRLPLRFGWKRHTIMKQLGTSGVKGEILYFSPDGKKVKSQQEVVRYLAKYNNGVVNKDNFSFSSHWLVGEFIEPGQGGRDPMILSESEIINRIDQLKRMKRKKGNSSLPKETASKSRANRQRDSTDTDASTSHLHDSIFSRLHGMVGLTPEDLINAAAGGGQLDQLKILHMLHQQAMKQSMNESREKQKEEEILKKIQERELKRQQAEKQKEEELQRRREMQIMAEMERERRKQHMILMRALDAHKRYEERERKREEMLVEKRLIQEKKMHKKRIEMELLKELKKPVDDMMLKDLQPLPTLGRISGLKLPGKAFADSLMVYEFLHNFGETLGFDMESLPSLNTLQSSLLNEDDDAEEELLSIVHHLLVCAIDDPGVPVMVTTAMGQKLKDAAITNYDISEILRIYLLSFSLAGREDYSEHKIFNILNTGKQFLSLNATQKAEIISYLCNELMCHQAVMRQVDENIDTIATLRRDKWVIDCESRKYKVIRQRRELLQGINQVKNGADESEGEEDQNGDKQQPLKVDSEAVIDDEESGDSGNENDENQTMINIAINTQFHGHEEEPGMSAEEIDKKIDKLNRQCTMATNKLNKAVNSLRVLSLGQDRFRRRYWILPTSGGVFVEGMESAEPNELAENEAGESMDEEEEEEDDEESETKGADMKTENSIEEKVGAESESKEETIQNGDASLVVEEKSEVSENMEESKAEEKQIVKEEKMDTESVNGNKEECNGEDVEKEDTKEEKPGESTWMSPIMASVLAGSMMFGNQGNGVPQFNMPFSKANNSEQTPNQKPWFSILPRMPCSETITISPSKSESHDQEMTENVGDNDASAILLANKDEIVKAAASGNFSNIPPEVLMQAFVYPQVLSSMLKARGIQGAEDSKPKEDSDVSRSASVTPAPSQANVSVDDLDICPSLQRKLIEQKEQQYDEAKKIPALVSSRLVENHRDISSSSLAGSIARTWSS
ncbi:Bromodomain adjacent to zinc finger domain protein 2B [Halotydeus destructor]|nr:Bromodomain adjacent to zinc finger domain protein 2B [Halotydeus destructor]